MLCSRCKKRMAVIFVSREINGKPVSEGLCFKCAKELGIPQISDIAQKMGISDEDIDNMGDKIMGMMGADSFEPGGAETMNPFMIGFEGTMGNGKGGYNNFADNPNPGSSSKADNSKKKEKKEFKYLDNFGNNLTQRARERKLDRIIGREEEIYRVIQILSRKTKNNPCLIGEPGVGKTAIAEGIAQRIASGKAPFRLLNKELYLLDMAALVAGTQFRGQFESRVKGLINEVKKAGNIILFIDEIHTLIGTGDSEGSMSAANILKPALSRGEVQIIGATTFEEYRKYIENDSALERRFQPVTVNEPNVEDTIKILNGIKGYYETHHRVKVTNKILRDAVVLSERYITDRYLPDKAIDLMDEACACRSLNTPEISRYEMGLKRYNELLAKEEELEAQSENPNYEAIAKIKANLSRLGAELNGLKSVVEKTEVTGEDLARVIELWTGIPAARIEQGDTVRIRNLEFNLKKRIIGQDEAVKAVVAGVRRRRVQLSKVRRPASFIFVGPTGVGKTELVKVLAGSLFDGVEPLIRLDMSEYMEKHTVSRLVGSPPGYVGYDDAGQLTEKVRRRPYSVILFDEIEKAHPDVLNILLQILDEGRITDSHGRTVNFENTVIVMTSNAGSGDRNGIVGFDKTQDDLDGEKVKRGLKQFLRPEFIARVDEVVVFHKLTAKNLEDIASIMLDELKEVLKERGTEFKYDKSAAAAVIEPIKDGVYGARDLRREIRRQIEDVLARLYVEFETDIYEVSLSAKNNKVVFSVNGSDYVEDPADIEPVTANMV